MFKMARVEGQAAALSALDDPNASPLDFASDTEEAGGRPRGLVGEGGVVAHTGSLAVADVVGPSAAGAGAAVAGAGSDDSDSSSSSSDDGAPSGGLSFEVACGMVAEVKRAALPQPSFETMTAGDVTAAALPTRADGVVASPMANIFDMLEVSDCPPLTPDLQETFNTRNYAALPAPFCPTTYVDFPHTRCTLSPTSVRPRERPRW